MNRGAWLAAVLGVTETPWGHRVAHDTRPRPRSRSVVSVPALVQVTSLFAQTDAVTFNQCGLTDFTPDLLTQSLHYSKSTTMNPTSNLPMASHWSSTSSLWLQLSRPQHDTARSQGCLSLALLMDL